MYPHSPRLYFFLRCVFDFFGTGIEASAFRVDVSSVTTGRIFFFFLPVRLSVIIHTPYFNADRRVQVVQGVLFGEQGIPESCLRQ